MLKSCSRCCEKKPLDQYHTDPRQKSGLRPDCKKCCLVRGRIWARNNPDKVRKANRKSDWRKQGIDFSNAEYERMLIAQDYKCKICSVAYGTYRFHVDHDHQTHKVRGLLCGPCNKGLGQFKDSPEILRLAAEYLGQSKYAHNEH